MSSPFEKFIRGLPDQIKQATGGGGKGGRGGAGAPKGISLKGAFGAAGVILLGAAALKSYVVVPGGHRGLRFNVFTGIRPNYLEPGLNLMLPFVEYPIIYDARARPSEHRAISGSKDLQKVDMAIRILFKPGKNLAELHRQLGPDFDKRLLPSVGNEVMKATLAQFNVAELLLRRTEVSQRVREKVTERCGQFNVAVEDVSIIGLDFGKEYMIAVEAKQIAQQNVEKARYKLVQAEHDKRGKILLAEGEAESAKLLGNAMTKNPSFLQLRKIEAAKEIAGTLASGGSRVYLDADSMLVSLKTLKDN